MLGKFASAAKEASIAWRYGVHPSVDAYVFLFNLITSPIAVWFSLLTVILAPLHAQNESSENGSDFLRFKSELLGFSMVLGVALAALAYLGLPAILQANWFELRGEAHDEAMAMAKGMSLLLPTGMLISLLSAWLLSNGNHGNTLLEAIPAIVILAFVLMPADLVLQPLVWGTVLGFAIQLVGLRWAIGKKAPALPRLGFRSKTWVGIWHGIGMVALGQMAMNLTGLVDQFFAAQLSEGSISILGYANRILSMVLSLCVLSISRATLPIFSKASASGDVDVAALARRWRNLALMAGLSIIMLGWPLAPTVVALVFERGAFDRSSTAAVSDALRFGLLQIPFYIAGIVIYSSNSGRQQYQRNAMAMLIAVVLKIASVYALAPTLGIKGIQISTAIMYMTFFLALTCTSERAQNGTR